MTMRTALCRGAALGALLACVVAPAVANAATKHHHAKTRVVSDPAMKGEVEALKAEVDSLEAWKQSQEASSQQTQAQVQQLQGQLTEANDRAARAEQQVAEQIQTIPGAVDQAVAAHAPKTDKIYYKGITLTLGGFAAAEGVYRTKNNVADIGSNYSKIPYDNNVLAHTDELRGTARQSRISFLAQGNVNPNLVASFYGEFDFLADAQTGNSNESNSYSPRIRNVYGALDWNDTGWHFLAGQNWSLVTMNGKGISPRNEVIPPTIEAQYVPGFVWARQPQIRIAHDFDDKQVWVALSLENPQTTFGSAATGTGTTFGGITVNDAAPGISLLNNVNNFSFNHCARRDRQGGLRAGDQRRPAAAPGGVRHPARVLRPGQRRGRQPGGDRGPRGRQLHRQQLGRRRWLRRHLDRGAEAARPGSQFPGRQRHRPLRARASCRT